MRKPLQKHVDYKKKKKNLFLKNRVVCSICTGQLKMNWWLIDGYGERISFFDSISVDQKPQKCFNNIW